MQGLSWGPIAQLSHIFHVGHPKVWHPSPKGLELLWLKFSHGCCSSHQSHQLKAAVAGLQFSLKVLHEKVMLINVSSWNGACKTLLTWESSPRLLMPSTGKFIFPDALVENKSMMVDGLGLLQRNFSQNGATKPVWYSLVPRGVFGEQWDYPGTSQMPHWLPLQDRPDGSSAGQRMRSNPENQIHPLKTQPKPFPSISLPFAWGHHQSGTRGWEGFWAQASAQGILGGSGGDTEQQHGWAGGAEFDAFQDFPVDLLAGRLMVWDVLEAPLCSKSHFPIVPWPRAPQDWRKWAKKA